MQYSQKYCLVAFLHQIKEGAEFNMNDWPLHITVVNVFYINLQITEIVNKMSILLAENSPITTVATERAVLGQTEVVLVKPTPDVLSLHKEVIKLLKSNGAKFDIPEHIQEGYIPHSTIQRTSRLNEGDEIILDSVTLVDMFPDQNWQRRKVLKTFSIGCV